MARPVPVNSPAWWEDGGSRTQVAAEALRLGASQDLTELADAIEMIEGLEPAVVCEIGCDRGGTLYAWRQVCPLVLGITTADNSYESGGSGQPLEPHGAVVHIGDSHDPASRAWLVDQLACCANPAVAHALDALVLDGDHQVDGLRADLADYGPLVRAGGLILIHDIGYTADPRAQVWQIWPELARRYQTGEIRNPAGGYGWGVIEVTGEDEFS